LLQKNPLEIWLNTAVCALLEPAFDAVRVLPPVNHAFINHRVAVCRDHQPPPGNAPASHSQTRGFLKYFCRELAGMWTALGVRWEFRWAPPHGFARPPQLQIVEPRLSGTGKEELDFGQYAWLRVPAGTLTLYSFQSVVPFTDFEMPTSRLGAASTACSETVRLM